MRQFVLIVSLLFCFTTVFAEQVENVRNNQPHYGPARVNDIHIIPLTITNNSCLGNLEVRITQNDRNDVLQHDKPYNSLRIQPINVTNGSNVISIEDPIWPVTVYVPFLNQVKTYDQQDPNATINGNTDCLNPRPAVVPIRPIRPGHHIIPAHVIPIHRAKVITDIKK